MKVDGDFDIIIIGAGHAGCEAALAAARMGCRVVILNLTLETIALMSCNPSIGGVAKGHLVKEVDAMGGVMGYAADRSCIHFKILNSSKGPAVRSSRAQTDREAYRTAVRRALDGERLIHIRQGMVSKIITDKDRFAGVVDETGLEYYGKACIVATGTFLKGLIHIGDYSVSAGRAGEFASTSLAECLISMGFTIGRMKTGTPPRLRKESINFDRLKKQEGDPDPIPFSWRTRDFSPRQIPCFITQTTGMTHRLVRENIGLSPLYSGVITGVSARYCPSLEDKVMRFPKKGSHPVVLEPEGYDSHEIYAKGLGNSLPMELQEKLVRSVPGLEDAEIMRPAYAIEYDFVQPTQLLPTLQTKKIKGLFLAGQINGTSGYEEAAAQGIWAGINAACFVQKRPPFILDRSEAYMAVLVDDLVTLGTNEPYRMFTSRAEYRLLLREDNADLRLTPRAYELGLVSSGQMKRVEEKTRLVDEGLHKVSSVKISPTESLNRYLGSFGYSPLKGRTTAAELIKRPGVTLDLLRNEEPALMEIKDAEAVRQIEISLKYEGYIRRQNEAVGRFRRMEKTRIPDDIDYGKVPGLSTEARQKLCMVRPLSLGQAARISGVTPAAVSILMVYLKSGQGKHSGEKA